MKRFYFSHRSIVVSILILFAVFVLVRGFVRINSLESSFSSNPEDQTVDVDVIEDSSQSLQLDYRVDLRKIELINNDDDPRNDVIIDDVLEDVLDTLRSRVANLDVAKSSIYRSKLGQEEHIIVELEGVKNIDEIKDVVGKVLDLQFKEQRQEDDPENEEVSFLRAQSEEILKQLLSQGDFKTLAEGIQTLDDKVKYIAYEERYLSGLPVYYKDILPNMESGEVYGSVVEGGSEFALGEGGQIYEKETLRLVRLISRESREKAETLSEDFFIYEEIVFDVTPSPWRLTGLGGAQLEHASVVYSSPQDPQVSIQFNAQGAEMFEAITDRLKGKPLGIFIEEELISAPYINEKIMGGKAVIAGNFTLQEALELANDLNEGAIAAPIILSGQNIIE